MSNKVYRTLRTALKNVPNGAKFAFRWGIKPTYTVLKHKVPAEYGLGVLLEVEGGLYHTGYPQNCVYIEG